MSSHFGFARPFEEPDRGLPARRRRGEGPAPRNRTFSSRNERTQRAQQQEERQRYNPWSGEIEEEAAEQHQAAVEDYYERATGFNPWSGEPVSGNNNHNNNNNNNGGENNDDGENDERRNAQNAARLLERHRATCSAPTATLNFERCEVCRGWREERAEKDICCYKFTKIITEEVHPRLKPEFKQLWDDYGYEMREALSSLLNNKIALCATSASMLPDPNNSRTTGSRNNRGGFSHSGYWTGRTGTHGDGGFGGPCMSQMYGRSVHTCKDPYKAAAAVWVHPGQHDVDLMEELNWMSATVVKKLELHENNPRATPAGKQKLLQQQAKIKEKQQCWARMRRRFDAYFQQHNLLYRHLRSSAALDDDRQAPVEEEEYLEEVDENDVLPVPPYLTRRRVDDFALVYNINAERKDNIQLDFEEDFDHREPFILFTNPADSHQPVYTEFVSFKTNPETGEYERIFFPPWHPIINPGSYPLLFPLGFGGWFSIREFLLNPHEAIQQATGTANDPNLHGTMLDPEAAGMNWDQTARELGLNNAEHGHRPFVYEDDYGIDYFRPNRNAVTGYNNDNESNSDLYDEEQIQADEYYMQLNEEEEVDRNNTAAVRFKKPIFARRHVGNIVRYDHSTKGKMTLHDYVKYALYQRSEDLLYFPRVGQQWTLDMFSLWVQMDFMAKARNKNVMAGVRKRLISMKNVNMEKTRKYGRIGRPFAIPPSVPGSPAARRQESRMAKALINRLGLANFWITFTCNPKWKEVHEIMRKIFPTQAALLAQVQDELESQGMWEEDVELGDAEDVYSDVGGIGGIDLEYNFDGDNENFQETFDHPERATAAFTAAAAAQDANRNFLKDSEKWAMVVTRVWHLKRLEFLRRLRGGKLIPGVGESVFVHAVDEYQKRYWPHTHILCRCAHLNERFDKTIEGSRNLRQWTEAEVDNAISAQLFLYHRCNYCVNRGITKDDLKYGDPDNEMDGDEFRHFIREKCCQDDDTCFAHKVYPLVKKLMMHKHTEKSKHYCGFDVNKDRPQPGDCRFWFPKEAGTVDSQVTHHDGHGHYSYKRPFKEDAMVVPHCPEVLLAFTGHCNVEFCGWALTSDYFVNYQKKEGTFTTVAATELLLSDNLKRELHNYIKSVHIGFSEAYTRMMQWKQQVMEPAVTMLQVHKQDDWCFTIDEELDDEGNVVDRDEAQDAIERKESLTVTKLQHYLRRHAALAHLKYEDYYSQYIISKATNEDIEELAGTVANPAYQGPKFLDQPDDEREGTFYPRRLAKKRTTLHVAFIDTPNFRNKERYAVSLLLRHLPATSFDDLLQFDGTVFDTFQQAAKARGLYVEDTSYALALQELINPNPKAWEKNEDGTYPGTNGSFWAQTNMMINQRQLRNCFIDMCLAGAPARLLYDDFWLYMATDLPEYRNRHTANMDVARLCQELLLQLENLLLEERYTLEDFDLPSLQGVTEASLREATVLQQNKNQLPQIDPEVAEAELDKIIYFDNVPNSRSNVYQADFLRELKAEYTRFANLYSRMHELTEAEMNELMQPRVHHLIAKAGTGKTHCCNKFVNWVRWTKDGVCVCTAPAAKVSRNFAGGVTNHKGYKLPVTDIMKEMVSLLTPDQFEGIVLRHATVIVIDEISMTHKKQLEAIEQVCRDIPLEGMQNVPFGGRIAILCGHYDQLPPVISRSKRSDVVQASVLNSPLYSTFKHHTFPIVVRQSNDKPYEEFLSGIAKGMGPAKAAQDRFETDTDYFYRIRAAKDANESGKNQAAEKHDGLFVSCELERKRDGLFATHSSDEALDKYFSREMVCQFNRSGRLPECKRTDETPIDTYRNLQRSPIYHSAIATYTNEDREVWNGKIDKKMMEKLQVSNNVEEVEAVNQACPDEYGNTSDGPSYEEMALAQEASYFPQLLTLFPGKLLAGMRNLSVSRDNCNGTRYIVKFVGKHHLQLINLTTGKVVIGFKIMQKICLDKKKTDMQFLRYQYPYRSAWAGTVHSLQGDTIKQSHNGKLLLDARHKPFAHGQTYVALSRVEHQSQLTILRCEPEAMGDEEQQMYEDVGQNYMSPYRGLECVVYKEFSEYDPETHVPLILHDHDDPHLEEREDEFAQAFHALDSQQYRQSRQGEMRVRDEDHLLFRGMPQGIGEIEL